MQNFGLHICRAPSGRFAFVGSIPAALAEEIDATKGDVLGGRAYRRPDGSLAAPRFPSFGTLAEAEEYAQARGVTDYKAYP